MASLRSDLSAHQGFGSSLELRANTVLDMISRDASRTVFPRPRVQIRCESGVIAGFQTVSQVIVPAQRRIQDSPLREYVNGMGDHERKNTVQGVFQETSSWTVFPRVNLDDGGV